MLYSQKKSCVLVVPDVHAPWVNFLKQYAETTLLVAKPYDKRAFTITHPTGKRVPKMYASAMIAVKVVF
jgi:hypothetical protein